MTSAEHKAILPKESRITRNFLAIGTSCQLVPAGLWSGAIVYIFLFLDRRTVLSRYLCHLPHTSVTLLAQSKHFQNLEIAQIH